MIPIEYEQARKEWLETAWLGIKRLLAERNRRELPVVRAKEKQMKSASLRPVADFDAAAAAVAQLVHYGRKIEQRRRGVLHGDADAEAQDWAEFRAALSKVGGAP